MADERVSIVIDVDVKDVASIAAVQAALANLNRSQKNNTASMRIMRGENDKTSDSLVGAARSTKQLEERVGKLGGAMKILNKVARVLLFTVIAMGIEFAITAAALASVNLIFATGRFLAKAYNFAMQGLAGAVAAAGVAALGAAAAFREFTAAQFAFRFKGSPNVKAGIADATGALQNLYQDSTLATAGIQALNQAFAAVAKNSAFTPQTQAGLKAMMDFAVASGDTTKGLSAAATFLGLIQKESKFTSEALSAAKQIGPEFDKAFKKLKGAGKINTTQDFFDLLASGELAKEAGVMGAAGIVQQTLFAQFKGYLTRLYGEVASIGQSLLEPFKKTLFDVFIILRRTVRQVSNELLSFGRSDFLSTIVKAVDMLAKFSVHLFRKFLPQADGFFGRINKVYVAMYRYTRRFLDVIRPLREGGRVIIDTFGPPIAEIFKGFGRNIQNLADLGSKNREKFVSFGEALKNLIASFFDMSAGFKAAFTEAIPIINKVIGAVALVMQKLGDLFRMFAGFGPMGSFMAIFGTLALGLKGKRAGGIRGMLNIPGGRYNGIPGAMGKGGVEGAMAPVQQAGATLQSAGTSLTGASTGLNGSSTALTSAAQAIINAAQILGTYGGVSQGKMPLKGGRIDRATGAILTLPPRPPGMSTQEYNQRLAQYRMMQASAAGGQATPATNPYGAMAQDQLRQQQSKLRLQQRQAAARAARGFGPPGTSISPNVSGTVIVPRPPSGPGTNPYMPTGALHSFFPKGTFKNLFGSSASGGGKFRDKFFNFLPSKQGFKDSWRTSKNLMKLGAQGGAGGIKSGALKFLGASAGGQQFLASYRENIKAQQDAIAKAGGAGKVSKLKALKGGLGGNIGLGSIAASMIASNIIANNKNVTEEAQGSLQAGASMAAISPLLGIAVGGIGTMMSAQTKAGGAISGAAGGAAAGALIGSIIPGVGTAAGALVGGIVGGVTGWFKGRANRNKLAKEAAKRASEANLVPVVTAMLEGNNQTALELAKKNTERAKKLAGAGYGAQSAELDRLVKEGVITSAERERALNDPGKTQEFFNRMVAQSPVQEKVSKLMVNSYEKTMQGLRQATGMSEEALRNLAHKMGVNLYSPTLKLNDAITQLGKGMVATAQEIRDAIRDNIISALDNLENFKTKDELGKAANIAQNAFNAATPGMDELRNVVTELAKYVTSQNPDSPIVALQTLGAMFDPKNPDYVFGEQGALGKGFSKLSEKNQFLYTETIRKQFLNPAIKSTAGTYSTQLGAQLANAGLLFSDPTQGATVQSAIENLLRTGTPQQIQQLDQFLKYGNFEGKSSQEAVTQLFKLLNIPVGPEGPKISLDKKLEPQELKLSEIEKEVLGQMTGAIENGFDKKPNWWDNDVPDWWTRGLVAKSTAGGTVTLLPAGDTSSPRGGKIGDTSVSKRLRSTLASHGMFNSRLTGKRTITSAFRTWNLGSMNSDHATGNAYDLTGQNLGQYAKMVNSSGGFAEFHGVNANRHLHVVPRTGDTTSSRAGDSTTATAQPTVNVNVYASPGMSVDELVSKTIRAQEKAMRDFYERI